MEPSIFQFATKELSQDAFFCWLLSWVDENYKDTELYKVAKTFVKEIIGDEITVNDVVIKQQYKKIDFLIRLNNSITIVFEDKKRALIREKQLEDYKNAILREYQNDKVFFVCLKTDLVSKEEMVIIEKHGYMIFDLYKIKKLLLNRINNDIYNDFLLFIDTKIDSYINFEKIEFSKWTQTEWIGFCNKLHIDYGDANLDKCKIWQGRELHSILKHTVVHSGKKVYTSLQIKHSLAKNNGRLTIILHNEEESLNRFEVQNNIIEIFRNAYKSENIQIKNRIAKKKCELVIFNDFLFIEHGYINYKKTKEYIDKIKDIFVKITYVSISCFVK